MAPPRYWRSALVPEMRYSGAKLRQKPTYARRRDFPPDGEVLDQAGPRDYNPNGANYVWDEKRPAAGCGGP